MTLAEIREKKKMLILKGVKDRLSELGLIPPLVTPILFGSLANDKWDGKSDIDLALIVNGDVSDLSCSISSFFRDPGTPRGADIIIVQATDIERCGVRDAIRSGDHLFDEGVTLDPQKSQNISIETSSRL